MNYKTPFIITLILLIACVLIYWFYLKPDYTQLERGQAEQQQIDIAYQIIVGKDSLLELYKDSLEQSKNNVKVITRTVIKEQANIITETLTDTRVNKTKTFLNDFYNMKVREIGIDPAPEIKLPEINLTTKEFKGTELLISDYRVTKLVNTELNRQTDLLIKSNDLFIEKEEQYIEIINLQESQLVKFEKTKIPIVSSRKWYVDVLIVTGALTAGFTAGIIYSNNR